MHVSAALKPDFTWCSVPGRCFIIMGHPHMIMDEGTMFGMKMEDRRGRPDRERSLLPSASFRVADS